MIINPHFRTVDEVHPPLVRNAFGWAPDAPSEREAIEFEQRQFARLREDMPVAFRSRRSEAMPEMLKLWNEFQADHGRYPGSADWSLLDEFVASKALVWKPQIIGSCVMSNTFRGWVIRMMFQIVMQGRAEEYLGRSEFGPENWSFYGPWSYGMARRRADMRRGDGLYCEPMVESLMKDGVVPCTTPALQDLCTRLNVDGETDYPEPQSASVYRAFGAWDYLDELKPYADYPVIELPMVESADQLWDELQNGKTAFVCSMEAIHKVGEHPDGFPIHARNPRDQWAHNMAFHGAFIASDGEWFFRQSNESWGGEHIYNRRFDEVAAAFRSGRLTSAAIGEIAGPKSSPPLVA